MGGHALRKVKVQRIPKALYQQIIQEITQRLNSIGQVRFNFPYETPGKEDFGDIDVLIDANYGIIPQKKIYNFIQELYSPVEISPSGPVTSFAYEINGEYYQVDFILVNSLEMAQLYFSYGDCGAIIGRFMSFYGLTYSESGLLAKVKGSYLFDQKYPENDQVLESIILSPRPQEVCDYLHLDYSRWKEGFHSIDEIYQWIITSRFYKPDFFLFMKMDHRKRLKLRPFYQKFLDLIDVNIETIDNIELKYELSPEEIYRYVMTAIHDFKKEEEFHQIEINFSLQQSRKSKFHSSIFLENGIAQTQLNEAMKSFKKEAFATEEAFWEWIDSHDNEEVRVFIIQWLQSWKTTIESK